MTARCPSRLRISRPALAIACAAALLAGCGGDSDLSERAEGVLKRDVSALATAARLGDAAAVRSALAVLQGHLAEAQESGDVSEDRADRVLEAARAVVADVPVPVAKPSPTPRVTSPAPAPAREGDAPRKKRRGKKD